MARWPPVASRRRVTVVVNTASGSARVARRALRALHYQPVDVLGVARTIGAELGEVIDAAVASSPPDAVLVVAGGDGTVGRAATAASRAGRVLGILPTGTGNDVARSLHLPLSPEEAAAVVARGDVGPMDLGLVGERAFAHAATAGITANFAERVRDVRGWRRPIVYPAMAWQAWRSRRPLSITVIVDGRPLVTPPPVQVAVVNAPRLGGRIGVTLPGATVDDGLWDVIVTYRHALRQMVRTLTALMRAGPAQEGAGGVIRRGRVVEIRGSADLIVALDGEPLAHAPLRAEAHAGACSVVRPKP